MVANDITNLNFDFKQFLSAVSHCADRNCLKSNEHLYSNRLQIHYDYGQHFNNVPLNYFFCCFLTWVVRPKVQNFYSASAYLAMLSAVLAIVNLSDRLSDRPSVTVRYCVKTSQARIMGSSLEDSPMTLVSSCLTAARNSKGNPGSEGAEWQRGGKSGHFLANKSRISETVQDRTIVTILITNRKSYVRFRLVPKSSTLGDPEWPVSYTHLTLPTILRV